MSQKPMLTKQYFATKKLPGFQAICYFGPLDSPSNDSFKIVETSPHSRNESSHFDQ